MPQFDTIEEVFDWFWENVYPNLPGKKKTGALRAAKHAFYSEDRKVSHKRMKRILEECSDFKVKYEIGGEK